MCDPGSTDSDPDPTTGVITCIGNGGGGGCGAAFACPAPSASKMTICGQLYDFQDMSPFADAGATGARCAAGATTGPCSLHINPYDAISFAMNPNGAAVLPNGGVYIDDCGRYRVTDISPPGGPFVALGIDDIDTAKAGPMGTTNAFQTWSLATATAPVRPTLNRPRRRHGDNGSLGQPLFFVGRYYVDVFRAHRAGGALPSPQTRRDRLKGGSRSWQRLLLQRRAVTPDHRSGGVGHRRERHRPDPGAGCRQSCTAGRAGCLRDAIRHAPRRDAAVHRVRADQTPDQPDDRHDVRPRLVLLIAIITAGSARHPTGSIDVALFRSSTLNGVFALEARG